MVESVRIVAQHYDNVTGKILKNKQICVKKIKQPNTIDELGFTHEEQIKILQTSQDFYLELQSSYINQNNFCSNCGRKLRNQGKFKSSFHALFTDHKITIQRKTCTCGHKYPYTIEGIYGNSLHPSLLEKQSLLGADLSYKKAEKVLNYESYKPRTINNDDRINRSITIVSKELENIKLSTEWCRTEIEHKELLLHIDGGHLKSNLKTKRSFEAMISTVYSTENIKIVDKNHNKITDKTSVASAKADKQSTMKKLTLNACKKQGMTENTTITALTDGANNCWSIVDSLNGNCKKIIKILDWFHIGKKFKEREHKMPEDLIEKYNGAKWKLWHGKPSDAIDRLETIKKDLENSIAVEAIDELLTYINRNIDCIVNYNNRRNNNQPYTSNVAESSINSLINSRQKQNLKMQWSRKGAHDILQVRTSMFSENWKDDWSKVKNNLYKEAV